MVQIIFYGLKRSGNHAIIHWILRNLDKNIKEIMPSYIHGNKEAGIVYFNDILKSRGAIEPSIESYSHFKHKFASVEEQYIDPWNTVMSKIWDPNLPIIKVFIIRDPLNCYSSRLKTFNLRNIDQFKNLFNSLIKERDSDKSNITVLYNHWWKFKDYRDKVSELIGIENKNDILITSKEGGKSAFDNKDYNFRKFMVDLKKEEIDGLCYLKY